MEPSYLRYAPMFEPHPGLDRSLAARCFRHPITHIAISRLKTRVTRPETHRARERDVTEIARADETHERRAETHERRAETHERKVESHERRAETHERRAETHERRAETHERRAETHDPRAETHG